MMLNRNIIRFGLALAAIFGWLLSFPMFGYLLFETAADQAPLLGLIFVATHGAGLIIFSLLPSKIANHRYNVRLAGVTLLVLTVTYAFYFPGHYNSLIFSLLGFSAAVVILAWTSRFTAFDEPLPVLAIAMTGANLIVAVTGIPRFLSVKPALIILALIAAAGIINTTLSQLPKAFIKFNVTTLGKKREQERNKNNERSAEANRQKKYPANTQVKPFILTLGAFAMATFFAGGIWYSTLSEQFYINLPVWGGLVDSLTYCFAIVFLAQGAIRLQPSLLASFSLSGLGTGLLAAMMCIFAPDQPAYRYLFHFLMLTGLAAADLFYWYGLWVVGQVYGGRRVFGLGLGFSLLLIAFSVIFEQINLIRPLLYNPYSLILGTAILILMTPLVLRCPLPPSTGTIITPKNNKEQAYAGIKEETKAKAGKEVEAEKKASVCSSKDCFPSKATENCEPHPVQLTAEISTRPAFGTNDDEPVVPANNLPNVDILTPAEKRIYLLLLQGIKDVEMAERLHISRHTVKFHVRNILRKYNVANRNKLLSLHLAQEPNTNGDKKRERN